VKSYVINLDSDRDRLAKIEQEFATAGMAFERVTAIYGADLPDRLAPYFLDADGNYAPYLTAGEVGCYASHLSVWRRMLLEEDRCALICEDDVRLAPQFRELIDLIIAKAAPGWDLIRLSSPTKRAAHTVTELTPRYSMVRYTKIPASAAGYLLSKAGAKKLLIPMRRTRPVDMDCGRPWEFNLDAYGVLPTPVLQDDLGVIPGLRPASSIDKAGKRDQIRRPRGFTGIAGRFFTWHRINRLRYNLRTIGLRRLIRIRIEHQIRRLSSLR
jgi:glycosyl transferase, family 25